MIIVNPRKVFLFFLLFFSFTAFAQITKEQRKVFHNTPIDIKVAAIKSGQLLEFATEVSIETFMVYMLWYKPKRFDKKYGYHNEEVLYSDSNYTYMGTIYYSFLSNFQKVKNEFLTGIDYLNLNREDIENRFKEEVLPLADRRKVYQTQSDFAVVEDLSRFKFTYIPAEKTMQISYQWKIKGGHWSRRIVNKEYQAKFSLITRQFIK
jgi:hypothetical protein